MLQNTRIFVRLIALIAVLLAFMLAIAVDGITAMSGMRDSIKTLYEERAVPLVQIAEILDLLNDDRTDVHAVATVSDPAKLAEIERKIAATDKDIDEGWKAYLGSSITPEEKKLADIAEKAKSDYRAVARKVIAAARTGNAAQLAQLELQDAEVAFDKVNGSFDALKQFQADLAKEEFEKANANFTSDSRTLFGILAAALICGAALALMIGRSIAQPLNQIIQVMNELTNGNLSVDVTGTDRGDEVGDVSRAVSVFKTGLGETERLRQQQGELSARADAERKQALLDMADEFENAVGGMVKGVAASATEMEATAQALAASSELTKGQAGAVAAAAENTRHNVHTVAAATEELSASFREINERVAESTQIIGQAVSQTQSTSQQVASLEDAANRIGTVVGLITDVAEQTNLLALNATIEAARAGDAGKGFAVVASEVKVLASQTAKATNEIRTQIQAIQDATRMSSQAIAEISRTIGRVNEISTSIAAAVEEQTAATGEISRNVSQAAEGTADVTANVAGVSEAAMSSSAAADQVLTAAGELSRSSEGLSEQVNTFLRNVRKGGQADEAATQKPRLRAVA